MSWAEVKKINSDMNMPLDSLIKSQRAYGASDDVLAVLLSRETAIKDATETNPLMLASFKPTVKGSVRISASVKRPSVLKSRTILIVKKGTSNILQIENDEDVSGSIYQSIYGDIAIEPDETYRIYAYTTTKTGYINSLKLCASIVDTSMIEYSSEV